MRSRTERQEEDAGKGRIKPVRSGLTPEQGKGIEYEFDFLMELSVEHIARILKDRTGKFQDKLIDKPDEKFGKKLIEWLRDGEVPPKKEEPPKKEGTGRDVRKAEKVVGGAWCRGGGCRLELGGGTDIDGRGGMVEVECERCEGFGFERTPIKALESE